MIGQPLTGLFRFRERGRRDASDPDCPAERHRFDDQLPNLRSGGRETCRLTGVPLIDGTGRFAGLSRVAPPA
jgi:hypothetical protein